MIKMFYSTREKYPASRVDLQDLFSKRVCRQLDIKLDWHMQNMGGLVEDNQVVDAAGETVFLGESSIRQGVLKKIQNQCFAFLHDCKTWFYLRKNNYDIVQVRDKFWVALVALVAMKGRGGVFCYWMSFPYAEADLYRIQAEKEAYSFLYRAFYFIRGSLTHWLLYRVILPRADFVFVQSEQMLEDVAKQGVARHKMMAVPMGIAWERLQDLPQAKNLGLPKEAKVAVYMGTMVKVRQLDFILEAFVHVLVAEHD
ncbi:MAG: glycosyltransferase, partial [Ghiorsea sp.]|nr:glycosyltransferase [Ghiorsea sp.]